MKVGADASVALKWMFRSRDGEQDVSQSLDLLQAVLEDEVTLIQPPHFLAEMAAVLARESPQSAQLALSDLLDIEMEIIGTEVIYRRAVALSIRLGQHLFDTLYHALALETDGTVLVTADARYYRKAHAEGHIVRIADFKRPTRRA